ncbi:photosystem reaction center subunit H [Mesorhizobium sp. Root552]|uniref:PRC-barrel domain-containing protein n=1 Tax=Mesorhizobium sp. Root552 TaxID=1736555 RepID=UPI0006F8B33B|nr:PRC-barrel domain-containing protein [Mesorhizobium sp. Root552]KQZ33395.1 photosystem reaction center subunit H [Mesorhizobium sp. Root552]
MIRTLLATTALATLLASGAMAQDTTAPAPTAPAPMTDSAVPAAPVAQSDGSLVTNIIGESVFNGPGDDAENIGNVSDVVFDKDGNATSVVIGVGGFLGIGAKDVAFDFDKLQWAEKNGDRWLIAASTKEELTAQPAFDPAPFEPAPAPQAAADVPATTTAPADGTSAPADSTAMAPATEMQTAPAEPAPPVERADGSIATQIIGENVYNGTGDDAQNIGSVNDIVLSKAGKAESLVIGVGGFLGLGQKNVAFDYGKTSWTEKNGDRWLVVEANKESLEALPDFDRRAYDPAPAVAAAGAETPATVTPTTDTAASTQAEPEANSTAPAGEMAAEKPAPDAAAEPDQTQTAAIDKSTLTAMPMTGEIRSEDLVGTTVYGADDAMVGEIGDVALTADSKVDAVIVDVGGFLGIGEKEVAVGMDNLKIMTDKDGKKYLYTDFTKEQLEAQAAYDKGSYTQKRDEQRLMLQ